jgi:hypothetical protein
MFKWLMCDGSWFFVFLLQKNSWICKQYNIHGIAKRLLDKILRCASSNCLRFTIHQVLSYCCYHYLHLSPLCTRVSLIEQLFLMLFNFLFQIWDTTTEFQMIRFRISE